MCPQCGSAAAVHSVEELAAMARTQLGGYPAGIPGAAAASGFTSPPPSTGYPRRHRRRGSRAAGNRGFRRHRPGLSFAQGHRRATAATATGIAAGQGPPPGYTGQRRPSQQVVRHWESTGDDSSIEDAVAGIVMGAATKFIGRAIGRRVKRAYDERVVPAMAAKQEAMLREQIAIAERHPTCGRA